MPDLFSDRRFPFLMYPVRTARATAMSEPPGGTALRPKRRHDAREGRAPDFRKRRQPVISVPAGQKRRRGDNTVPVRDTDMSTPQAVPGRIALPGRGGLPARRRGTMVPYWTRGRRHHARLRAGRGTLNVFLSEMDGGNPASVQARASACRPCERDGMPAFARGAGSLHQRAAPWGDKCLRDAAVVQFDVETPSEAPLRGRTGPNL